MREWLFLIGLLVLMIVGGAQAQRTSPPGSRFYVEAGTGAEMDFFFAQGTAFGLQASFQGGVKDLAGPFGVGGRFALAVQGGGAAFDLGLDGIFHFGREGLVPLAGLGFRVFFGGGQTAFGLGALAGTELTLNRNASLVAQARPTLWFTGGTTFGLGISLGLRVYP